MLPNSFGAAQKQDASGLDNVLRKMDETAAHFQTAQADFVFDQYQKVVDETDTQKGHGVLPQGGTADRDDGRVHRSGQEVRAL